MLDIKIDKWDRQLSLNRIISLVVGHFIIKISLISKIL